MVLDAVSLDAILQEARSCFLYEDAPDYLTMLEQGMQRLVTFAANPSATNTSDLKHEYTVLMRAAHSIKGGAGIAQLPSLNKLAHKLEDLLQALDAGRVEAQTETAYELLFLGIEQIKELVAEAINNPNSQVVVDSEVANSLPLVLALEGFLQEIAPQVETEINDEAKSISPIILKTVLEVDLEECLQRVEQLLQPPVQKQVLQQGLASFIEECTLLGQTLSLAWLEDAAEALKPKLGQNDLASIATETIAQMRELRSQTLNPKTPTLVVETTPVEPQAPATPTLNLRIPVSRLDRMNNTLGELLIGHERLSLYHSQLHQANVTLNKEAQKLNPINEQVRIFYDQLATPLASSWGVNAVAETTNSEFDSLQFDQYTGFHSTLQDLQEVMVRVQETKSDIELVTRDVQAALDQLRQQLDGLRGDLTQSRLVPFKFLAERFVAPLQNLSQRYQKSVELVIVGKETLIALNASCEANCSRFRLLGFGAFWGHFNPVIEGITQQMS
jgi:chemotaxis protein histidine kinase CheA